jgi:hypothetical protein
MTYRRLDEYEQKLIKKVQERTITDYEVKGEFVPVDSFISMLEDLLAEVDRLEEEKEDLERDMQDNYRKVTVEEQIDYSDRW